MARLFADEDFPLQVIEELRQLGHDALTLQEAGKGGQRVPDDEVLRLAQADNRVLITFNRIHFKRLHRRQPTHAGIIICRDDADRIALAHRIHQAITSVSSLIGKLIRVNRP